MHSQLKRLRVGVVVQLVRIHACHAWGRGFESRPYRKREEGVQNELLFLCNFGLSMEGYIFVTIGILLVLIVLVLAALTLYVIFKYALPNIKNVKYKYLIGVVCVLLFVFAVAPCLVLGVNLIF